MTPGAGPLAVAISGIADSASDIHAEKVFHAMSSGIGIDANIYLVLAQRHVIAGMGVALRLHTGNARAAYQNVKRGVIVEELDPCSRRAGVGETELRQVRNISPDLVVYGAVHFRRLDAPAHLIRP